MKTGMKHKSYIVILISFLTFASPSCNREPVPPPEPVINHITIAQLRGMYESGITTVDTNVYIRGIITLTPEFENIPSFISYIQDSTSAICITVSDADNTLAMNSKVRIFCNGLSFTDYNGLLQFGDLSINSQVEMISLTSEAPVPDTVSIDQVLTGEYEGRFVYFPDVQFEEPGTFSGSKVLTDCISNIEVYTRSAAAFSTQSTPAGRGSLKGISSVFNDQQIILRDPAELNMTGDRCNSSGTIYLSQDFNTIARYANVSTLAGWLTYPEAGTKTWYGNIVSGKGIWVQATAYNSGEASVISWMITPQVDLTGAIKPYISFDSADGYDNGATMELYASSDYSGSTTPWTSTWTKLSFTLPPLTPTTYSSFVSSGKVDLSVFNGKKIYVAWVYKGGAPSRTTTWEVDNVTVGEK